MIHPKRVMPARSGGTAAGTRYLPREKLLTFGDDFWIENDRGERIFLVDDKVLRVRDTMAVERGATRWRPCTRP